MIVFNLVCLGIWIFHLVVAIGHAAKKEPVDPVIAICAIIVCVVYYLSEVFA